MVCMGNICRSPTAEGVFREHVRRHAPGLDIEIDHPTTSSRHAVIHATARPGRLRVEDPGSTNGTFLGEHMIEKSKPHELRDGEAVRFGGFNVIVKVI